MKSGFSTIAVLKNSRGSALLNAIMFSAIMLVASGVMMYQSLQTQKMSRQPRIRTELDRIEKRVREIALDPMTYSGCSTIDSSAADANNTCKLNSSLVTSLASRIPGCHKSDGSPCGVSITNVSLDNATGVFSATVNYEGSETPIRPSKIEMAIPKDVLQADIVSCPVSKPIFHGFDSKGKMICKAINNAELCNVPGSYIKDINSTDFSVTSCSKIKNTATSCAATDYISKFNWNGGADAQVECSPRKDPWVLLNYTPVTSTGAAKDNGFLPLASLPSPTSPVVNCVDIPVVPTGGGGPCVDTSWTPTDADIASQLPNTCNTVKLAQTSNCGNTKSKAGTKDCSGGGTCTDFSWSPTDAEIAAQVPNTCNTVNLAQTSNCGNTKSTAGTKDCSGGGSSCTPITWTPDPATMPCGQSFTQTSVECPTSGKTQTATGTKNCVKLTWCVQSKSQAGSNTCKDAQNNLTSGMPCKSGDTMPPCGDGHDYYRFSCGNWDTSNGGSYCNPTIGGVTETPTCTLDGVTVKLGESADFYSMNSYCISTITMKCATLPISRRCTGTGFDGDPKYKYSTCKPHGCR